MAENQNQPQVINKSGSLVMKDSVAKAKEVRGERAQSDAPRRRRPGGFRRDERDNTPKEYEELTISIDRVARVVAGGRRFRFKALVAVGNGKGKIGVGVAKGADVTSAITKATDRAKKSVIVVPIANDTIPHEIETKVSGAKVLMKPAAPGTGIIAGGVVRSIIGLTGVKNMISKSLGSTNKVNIAYAVIEGLKAQVPREQWITSEKKVIAEEKATKTKTPAAKKTAKKEDK